MVSQIRMQYRPPLRRGDTGGFWRGHPEDFGPDFTPPSLERLTNLPSPLSEGGLRGVPDRTGKGHQTPPPTPPWQGGRVLLQRFPLGLHTIWVAGAESSTPRKVGVPAWPWAHVFRGLEDSTPATQLHCVPRLGK